jgi:glutathione S-transferase
MRLIGRYASPFVRRVAVTLQVYDLPYDHLSVMPFGADQERLKRINPISRVPALELDDGEVLVDSAVILDYLDQLVGPEQALIPSTGPARRCVLSLLAVAIGTKEKLVAALYERHFRPADRQHQPWIDRCEAQVIDGYAWLEQQFDGDWLTGGQMTQADLTVAVFWLFGQAKRPGFFGRMTCPRIAALAEGLGGTAAFLATVPEEETLSRDLSAPD